ncbi:MAG: hypothetical protein ABSB69_16485 [Solirubrobacteraceae bacterium]
MALITEPRAADGPDAGVIEEARRRQRRRRAAGIAFVALAAIVAAALWIGGGSGGGSSASGERVPTERPLKLALVRGRAFIGGQPAPIGMEPSLQAGNVGVCITIAGQGGGCNGPPPTATDPIYGGGNGVDIEEKVGPRGEIDALFTGPGVAAVRVAHLGTFTAHHVAGFSAATKEVVFYRPPGARGSVLPPDVGSGALGSFEKARGTPALTETLLDASGRAIPIGGSQTFTLPNSYWQGAEAPPARGRCAMSSSLPGVKTQWGQVTQQIAADPSITVPAWLTCLHVWYSAGAAAYETAILLNASSPGSAPAPLWGAIPVPGHPGIVEIPPVQREIHFRIPKPSSAQVARELARDTRMSGRTRAEALMRQVERAASKTGEAFWDVLVPPTVARRVGPAWLLVRYGDSLAQRIAFLNALHVTRIELPHARG